MLYEALAGDRNIGALAVEEYVKLHNIPLYLFSYQDYWLRHNIPYGSGSIDTEYLFWIGSNRQSRLAINQKADFLKIFGATPDKIQLKSGTSFLEWDFFNIANSAVIIPKPLITDLNIWVATPVGTSGRNVNLVYPELVIKVGLTDQAVIKVNYDIPGTEDLHRLKDMVTAGYTFNSTEQREHITVEEI